MLDSELPSHRTFFIGLLVTAMLIFWSVSNASGQTVYDASLGTLPQNQGWTYSGDNGNPSPVVSGGILSENTTVGGQYWTSPNAALNLSQPLVIEANLHIISSNYIANAGMGTREGYYLFVRDQNSNTFSVGLADSGFNINTTSVSNQALTPYPAPITGGFHIFRVQLRNGVGSLSIDNVLVAANVPFSPPDGNVGPGVFFGAVASASINVSELKSICYDTSGASSCLSRRSPGISDNQSTNHVFPQFADGRLSDGRFIGRLS
jgi:hypothetical protein